MATLFTVLVIAIIALLFVSLITILLGGSWRLGQKIRDFIFPPKK